MSLFYKIIITWLATLVPILAIFVSLQEGSVLKWIIWVIYLAVCVVTTLKYLADEKAKKPKVEIRVMKDEKLSDSLKIKLSSIPELKEERIDQEITNMDNEVKELQYDYGERKVDFYHLWTLYIKSKSHFQDYFLKYFDYFKRRTRIRGIILQIENTRNIPARNLHISLYFPDNIGISLPDGIPHKPELPTSRVITESVEPIFKKHFYNLIKYTDENIETTSILEKMEQNQNEMEEYYDRGLLDWKRKGYEINSDKDKLIHHDPNFIRIYIEFPHKFNIKSFHIKYLIRAENMPKKKEGRLTVNIE